jgi:glycosyltransferase involved in cell wall biosynthesis
MRILYVADMGSPIAQNWVRRVIDAGHEVHAVSTYPATEPRGLASFHVIPVALSGTSRPAVRSNTRSRPMLPRLVRAIRGLPINSLLMRARHLLGAQDVIRLAPRLRALVDQIRPDLVHALRLPFEGFLAAQALRGRREPLLVSVWGNDFTLHAAKSIVIDRLTRRTLQRADAIHPDCHRDLRLAWAHGFHEKKAALVAPSCGGVRTDVFHPGEASPRVRDQWKIAGDAEIVLNPRGVRAYVRKDTFFQGIPEILRQRPKAVFLAVGNAGDPESERWVRQLGIEAQTRLLPLVPHDTMADLFRSAVITVSPSMHDGTPNTLLESMACGSFPIAGDIESVREWIDPGVNGLLFAPDSAREFAAASVRALAEPVLREAAFATNQGLVRDKAAQVPVFAQIERFYAEIAARGRTS